MANITCNEVGARQLLEFMDEYALDDLAPLSAAIRGQSERAIRERIAALPDGVYEGTLDIEGIDNALRLACRAEVDGRGISLDFAGTSPPVNRGINVPLCYTRAMTGASIRRSAFGIRLSPPPEQTADPWRPAQSRASRPAPRAVGLPARHGACAPAIAGAGRLSGNFCGQEQSGDVGPELRWHETRQMPDVGRRNDHPRPVQGCSLRSEDDVAVKCRIGSRRRLPRPEATAHRQRPASIRRNS